MESEAGDQLNMSESGSSIMQLSVWLPNMPGTLRMLAQVLGSAKINISLFILTETGTYNIIRIIVDEVKKAKHVLEAAELPVKSTEMLVLKIPDKPGQLACIGQILSEQGINIEYLYGLPYRTDNNISWSLVFIYTTDIKVARDAIEKSDTTDICILRKKDLKDIKFFSSPTLTNNEPT